jgi:type III restriction enzyme
LSANNDHETEKNQILLNTLEDQNNPIRAVFAVQKLNEGWDVLNLFDIVRLYEGKDGRGDKPGKTTISEAQLIGRGARYFPFSFEGSDDKYKRKFDNDISNELKIIEELYYHTREDSRYIYYLKNALIETGIYEDNDNMIDLKVALKESFINSNLYKNGKIFINKRIEKSKSKINSLNDFGLKRKNYSSIVSSGKGIITKGYNIFDKGQDQNKKIVLSSLDILVKDIPFHIKRYALSRNDFFNFSNLRRFFPNIKSINDFILNEKYLDDYEITLKIDKKDIDKLSNNTYLNAFSGFLKELENEIKQNEIKYTCSEFKFKYIKDIFSDKNIRVNKYSERANDQSEIVANAEWYAHKSNYGTSEEKEFIKLFSRYINDIKNNFKNIYLLRNERQFKIFDEKGRAFEPDFVLFCEKKSNSENYQVFIEPKGSHLILNDKWKETFLNKIRADNINITLNSQNFKITAVPFYNYELENNFKKSLNGVLNCD